MTNNKELGRTGENEACLYLEGINYTILERNYRNFLGEIDIIALSPEDYLVFVEVKTRSNRKYGYAFEAVNYKKQQKILKTSMIYISSKELSYRQLRYDIIEVYSNENFKINHIKNAFGR